MAQTKSKKPNKEPAAQKPRAAVKRPEKVVDRTAELSREVLESIEAGHRAAIEAVRKFVDSVEGALPSREEAPSRRQEIVDSAMEMADRLVHTQYDFIRKVVDSAGHSLGASNGAKSPSERPAGETSER